MTFSDQAQQELQRLTARKKELEAELVEVNSEVKALTSYLKSKGTVTPTRRTGTRQKILDFIVANPGTTRAIIIENMDARGDSRATRSVDNAISALVKAGKLTKTDDRYASPI